MRFLDNQLKTSEILKRALIGLSNCLIKLSETNESVDSLTLQLESSSISSRFEDDLSSNLEYFRTLLLTQSGISDYLNRIYLSLVKYHPEDTEVLQIACEISLKLNSLLTAQKLAVKLLEKGRSIPDSIIERINDHRSENVSLWQFIPLLN